MATDRKRPLSQAAAPAPAPTRSTRQRSKVARRRAIGGALIALVIVGGLVFLLTRDGKGGGILAIGEPDREVPTLTFEPRVVVKPTTDTKAKQLQGPGEEAAAGVDATITTLFTGSFIDPEVWDGDEYEDLFGQTMDPGAASAALADLDTLTLGAGAGDVYGFVEPGPNKLTVRVLTDGNDVPIQAIAEVTFRATAEHDDETFSAIEVAGVYFLRPDGDTWRIFTFDVTKQEEPRRAPAPATPSATEATP